MTPVRLMISALLFGFAIGYQAAVTARSFGVRSPARWYQAAILVAAVVWAAGWLFYFLGVSS